jgi:hypothetical protein
MKDKCKFCGDNPCLEPHCPYTPEELRDENTDNASNGNVLHKDTGQKRLRNSKREVRVSVQVPRRKK